jgi:D-alanine-D-alanine ligase
MEERKHMKTIGVFFGSKSAEHDISIITAQLIISGLKGLGYNIAPVYITREGNWMIDEELGKLAAFTNPAKEVSKETKYRQYFLDLENSNGKMVFKKKGFKGLSLTVDLAFPAFHGTFGEDGTIQGLFEILNVPYVGCNVATSAVAMDKTLVKQICKAEDIPTAKFASFQAQDWEHSKKEIIDKVKKDLKFPVFVKPVHLGSSIGIGKARDEKELEEKIEVALYYDNKVLVEEGVQDLMDVTCCILGNEKLTASEIQESVFQADLFDFEEKYLNDGGAQLGKSQSGVVIPARLDKETTKKIQETAKEVYKTLGCSGIARVDFLYNKKTKNFYIAEVNPLPGTLYHHLWKASGIELDELIKRLIILAEEKHKQRQNVTYSFKSSVLTNLNSQKLSVKGNKLNG